MNLPINKILCGDTLKELEKFPDDCIDVCVTSPPYWGLRDYGVEGQLGLEKTLEEYLKKLLAITLELKRVLKPTGVLYWNHGDSYCGGQPGGSIHGEISGDRYNESNIPQKSEGRPQGKMDNYQEKCLIMQNERLAIKMIDEQGWILRNRIIWYKPNAMPSSVKDRFKNSYEPVYMFVKARRYYFDLDAVRLPHKTESLEKYQRQINVGLDGGNRDSKYLGTEFDGVLGGKRTPLPNWFKDSHGIDKDYKEEVNEKQQNLLGEDDKKGEKIGHKYTKGSEFERKYGEPWDRFGKNTKKAKKQEWHPEKYGKDDPKGARRGRIVPENDVRNPLGKNPGDVWDIKEEQKKAVEKEGKVGSAQRLESFFDKYGGKTNPMGKNRGDMWEISTHPFPDAHFACVDSKTKILTINGWKNYKEIKWQSRIKIATYNLKKRIIEYQPISYLKEYDYDSELLKIGNRDLDILITLNHRNIVVKRNSKEEIVLAENLKYSDKIKVLAPVEYKIEYSIGKKWAELTGWIISEGHYKKGGYIEIYQNIGKNEKRIDYLLKEIPHTKHIRRKNQAIWFIKKCALTDWLYQFVPEKELNRLLVSLPKKELKMLFRGLIAGDGSVRKDGRLQFIQKSRNCVDWFEILAMRLGYHTLTTKRKIGNCYDVFLTKKIAIGIRGTNGKGKSIQKVFYKGKIWCPKTPNGTWIAKRNGKVFITGNTFPEKLIEPMILSGCPKAGIVLDPFLGSGTVAIVAKKLGFNWIGIEINPEYVKMAEGRINAQTKPLF